MIRPSLSSTEAIVLPEIGSDSDAEAAEREQPRARPARQRVAIAAPAPTQRRTSSLLDLLQTRSGLRQALVLQEILGPPKSQRQ